MEWAEYVAQLGKMRMWTIFDSDNLKERTTQLGE